MGAKLIYFVRHGETEANVKGIRQGSEGSLSEIGRDQAMQTAQKFPKEKGRPEAIIASPYERTKETAGIIAKVLNMSVEYSDLLVERKNPSEVIGHSTDERKVRFIMDQIDKSFHDDNFRYSDEENFVDLKKRARKLLSYITGRPEKRLIMVTHSRFLKMIISYMLNGEKLTSYEYNKLSYFNGIDNAGMTIAEYVPHWFKKDEWKIITWNDAGK